MKTDCLESYDDVAMNKVTRSPRAWRGVSHSWRRDKKRQDMSAKSAGRRSNAKCRRWLSMAEWINRESDNRGH